MPTPDPDQPAEVLRDDLAAWLADGAGPRADEPLVVRTSGSTGRPKQVVLSRAAVLASADATGARLGGPGAWLLTLPHAYVAGVQVLVRSLHAGHAPVLRGEGETLAAAVARLQGPRRYTSLVPTQLHRLLDAAGSRQADADLDALASLDRVLLGGGPVDDSLRERAAERGIATTATYGMAETAGGCVYDGRPLDGVEVRTDGSGRVLLRGPVLFSGYRDDPEATAAVLRDGWFATSDAGVVTADGELRLWGRLDDVVVSGGVNVPGGVVARRLREHPDVVAAEALGVDDVEWGRRLVAFVVPRPGAQPDVAALRAWVTAVHPRAWAPREVRVVSRLPLLANGKTDRRALVDALAPGQQEVAP